MKQALLIFFVSCATIVFAQKNDKVPIPSKIPNKAQKQMIARKYGMFIHFGINTFHDQEWSSVTNTKKREMNMPCTFLPAGKITVTSKSVLNAKLTASGDQAV